MPTVTIPTGIKGPLTEGVVGIILGRTSISLQGLTVIPGVTESDFTGDIKVMVSPPSKNVEFLKDRGLHKLFGYLTMLWVLLLRAPPEDIKDLD